MVWYKVLGADGKSCHGGSLEWSLPRKVKGKWVAGAWHEAKGELKLCENGLHVTTDAVAWWTPNCRIYVAQAQDFIRNGTENKIAARRVRLLREVAIPARCRRVQDFIDSIKEVDLFARKRGKPLPPIKKWKVFETRDAARNAAGDAAWGAAGDAAWGAARDAAGDAAWDAAWDAAKNAARDAAGDAAWGAAGDAAKNAARDAAWDAAKNAARGATWGAAWGAAGDAARDAAWDAAKNAAGDAVRDAAWNAEVLLVNDLIAAKHARHLRERWEAWKRGYGVLCDVNGVLYVYRGVMSSE